MKRTAHPRERRIALLSTRLPSIAALCWCGLLTTAPGQFAPGEGGWVPEIAELSEPPGMITSLWVKQIDREPYHFISGTEAILDLGFSTPSSYGASSFDLQQSADGTGGWTALYSTVSAEQDNFSFNPGSGGHFRLLVHGGPRDGQVSNVVQAQSSLLDTQFSGWGIGTDFGATGIMAPWVGHAQTAYFNVRDLSDGSDIYDGVSFQWYRVDPTTGDATAISGAADATYVTTLDDVGGYELICRGTGNGVTVGGFAQVKAFGPVVAFNRAEVSDVDRGGFTLSLHKSVPSLAPGDLKLSYWGDSGELEIPISSVTAVSDNAVFQVVAEVPDGVTGANLGNLSSVWRLGMQFGEGEWAHQMEGLWIEFPTGGTSDFTSWTSAMGLPVDRCGANDCNGPLWISNLVAYAMGIDPMTATSGQLPQVSGLNAVAGSMHVIYRRAKNHPDATLAPRISPDLVDWSPADVISETILEDGGDWEVVDATISFTPGPVGFLDFAAVLQESP
ncbi:MAG: hypothetical protein H7A48_10690 [Akkermansiaceae bacterium]|nr:hypothetical protein [Akkermansiaceae bacterium]